MTHIIRVLISEVTVVVICIGVDSEIASIDDCIVPDKIATKPKQIETTMKLLFS